MPEEKLESDFHKKLLILNEKMSKEFSEVNDKVHVLENKHNKKITDLGSIITLHNSQVIETAQKNYDELLEKINELKVFRD